MMPRKYARLTFSILCAVAFGLPILMGAVS